ncbi:Y-family DNA polymerase [Pseudomarimonas arenosa]|uniref:DNA polymerase Y family protein n=1 Tax=Pseudomarimonas arenosa TaxID=2774145 RepID=A0AAW3ZKS2_9GAMM|nr:DNA polymerase Y family protein [Pseudomarimonas arenosa]MBD8526328.1 DNA polymerase Y family protein [Pseudomarimonas arenosa]
MLWAAITLPQLPLEVAFSTPPELPRAVIDGPSQRPVVLLPCRKARKLGVRSGHTLAEARALAAQLEVQKRQIKAEVDRLSTLAAWAYGFSSQVVLRGPDALLLEVGASLNLFGGWPRLRTMLVEGLRALEHAHCLAVAPTPLGAERMAQAGLDVALSSPEQLRNALTDLPITHTGLDDKLQHKLHSVGWRKLGELMRAPRPELGRRFGPELGVWLDRLLGQRPDPKTLYRPPDRFDRLIEFDGQIESLEGLGFPLQRLCRELAAYLNARDGGVLEFMLLCGHDDMPATPIQIGLRQPQRDAQALFEAARGKLERSPLPGPLRSLSLHAEHLPPFVPERRDLFDPLPRGELDWNALSERLQARLGQEAIRYLNINPDHRPERAWRLSAQTECYEKEPTADRTTPPRPLWLLSRPLPLRHSILRTVEDVERIETGWWDGDDMRRDYVIAELDNGQLAWLYREAGSQGPWMLQGWFG